jgi:hypothetical protein
MVRRPYHCLTKTKPVVSRRTHDAKPSHENQRPLVNASIFSFEMWASS